MNNEKRELSKKMKRAGFFIMGYFLIGLVVSALLIIYTNIPQWLNGLIVILGATFFYLIFLFVCAKLDKKKELKALNKPKEKDPFAD